MLSAPAAARRSSPDLRPPRAAAALSAWCIAHPRRTLLLWALAVVALTVGGFSMQTHELRASQSGTGESRQAEAALERAGLTPPNVEAAVVTARTPDAAVTAARRVAAAWSRVPQTGPVRGLSGTTELQRSADRRSVLLQTTVNRPADRAGPVALHLRRAASDAVAGTGATVHQTGVASIGADADARSMAGMRTVELVSLPATLLILLLTFGSVAAALLPVSLGVVAVAAGLAATNAVSGVVPMAEAAASIIVLLGLATTVDYSLFCVKRFREEMGEVPTSVAAATATMATVGRAVLVAAITVVVALSSMVLAGSPVFTSMAVGSMLVVTLGALSALTALPAILVLAGRRLDAGRLPWARRPAAREAAAGLWARVARRVVRRPAMALILVVMALLAMAAPAHNMRLGASDSTTLPQDLPAIEALHVMERAFPSGPSPATVVITGGAAELAARSATIRELGMAARRATEGTGAITSQISRDGSTIALTVPARDLRALEVRRQTAALRAAVRPYESQLGTGSRVLVTGMSAATADFSSSMRRATPLVLAFVLLVAFLLLRRSFGSSPLAVAVILLNLLSIAATYGLLVTTFQGTWAESLLGFTSIGAVVDWLPLFAFVVLFGLSMDYTVMVLERVREARQHGERPGRATVTGLAHTAGSVTSAAAVMVVVFALFGLIDFLDLKQLGVGMAVAVLLDATVVRAIGLPAIVALLGDRWRVPAPSRGAERTREIEGAEVLA